MPDEKDLKTGETLEDTTTTGQVESPLEETPAPETEEVVETESEEVVEDINALPDWAKAKMEKLENDKENYKKGLLKYKKFSLTPEEKKVEVEEEEYPDWDDASKKFQKQTLSEAEKRAEAKAQAMIEKANEKTAISQFIAKHPDAQDKWDDVVSNYSSKNGKESTDAIIKDLEKAYLITRFERGELEPKDKKSASNVANLSTVSRTTSKKTPEGKTLSKGSLEMATRFRIDPKKLAEEDETPYATAKF